MTRGDLANSRARLFSVNGHPTTAAVVTTLSTLVQEVVILLLVYLAIIIPVFRRETFLQSLDNSLQTQLALAASLQELDIVAITSVGEDVA